MADAVAVLGSRHGILWNPVGRSCGIVRFDRHTKLVGVQVRAGIVIEGVEYVLPLCSEGAGFDFVDQRTSPCTMSLMGIHAGSCVKVKLTAATPFRPRDAAFSTTPVIGLRLSVSKFAGIFRWEKKTVDLSEAEIFVEISGPAVEVTASGSDSIDLRFESIRGGTWEGMKDAWDDQKEGVPQHDRIMTSNGGVRGKRFVRKVGLAVGKEESLDLFWCTWSGPTFDVHGVRQPFKYAGKFGGLEAVVAWARAHGGEIFENAAKVDGIVGRNNLSASTNHLLGYTLHSWLINTWWVERAHPGPLPQAGEGERAPAPPATGGAPLPQEKRDFFAVWEGTCYMCSTEDVEYTQSPFYLAVWPELLGYELDAWAEFAKPGEKSLGERGRGTVYFSHDIGAHASATGQIYSHDMEVEETTNWLILMYCYWRRTGDAALIDKHYETITRALAFLERCDTTGNGVPDVGVANTIDDASPAIQFGREQVYLAIKTLAASVAGAWMLEPDHQDPVALMGDSCERLAKVIEEKGWLGEHYATLLEKRGVLKNPWTHKEMVCEEIPGWDAPQIYTANGIALLDMVGRALPLNQSKLARDLRVATERCLREYGCVHSDFRNEYPEQLEKMLGLVGVAPSPGWISMNMLRDIAAFYRGVDLRALADRYWEWQVMTNSQEPKLFFETFNGNNLSFYPRGIAIWGYFDALAGLVIDRVAGVDRASPGFAQVRVPRLFDADWKNGTCAVVES